MDLAVILGALAGAVGALVPGLHPNTVAALVGAHGGDAAVALGLVACAAAFGCAVPAVGAFLGASDEAALSASPAQHLLAEGRGREAAELAADGAVTGALLALPTAAVAMVALRAVSSDLHAAAAVAVAALVVALVAAARRRRLTLVFLLLSGLLGLVALRLGARSPLGLPASALLPLLGGLFGAPGLLSLAALSHVPLQKAYRAVLPRRRLLRLAGRGMACGSLVGLLPALTPAAAAAPALKGVRDREDVLVVVAATTGAGVVFTLQALFSLGRARSGALAVARDLAPPPEWRWSLLPPAEAATWGAATLAGVAAGYAFARAAAVALPHVLNAVGAGRLGLVGLTVLGASIVVFTGWLGALVAATGCALGVAAGRAGVARTSLLGCLLVPALVALMGLGGVIGR